ncbi:MAG: homing endonuclease associated repeat-containing protein [Nocardioidaceae bacterium]
MRREDARQRAEVMAERWRSGDTLAAIGDDFGLSRQRVQQILHHHGLATAEDAAQARRKARDRVDDRERMRTWLTKNPGASRSQLAAAVHLPSARVGALLEDDMRRLLVTNHTQASRWSDDEVLDGLRRAAAESGQPLTGEAYRRWMAEHGGPTSGRIGQRWGTWRKACLAAGLDVGPVKRTYNRRWSKGLMISLVADYLAETKGAGTHSGFKEWARHRMDSPSPTTLRNTFWASTEARRAGLRLLAQRSPH